ncbi:MAG TPA: phosphoglycerate dehydrogenase [Bacillota bacterium]|jgi:D-3-phosphoglycerate dehydrogenase|nr:phosphoglycerate dehydrogenase [Bacillota bacterium]HOL09968.1 phosphoglycerate dehydrogenase [Bacillota bacterium]HPO97967.1 phosphoglycerate dehydrogenase [Bacillota bacterium]
MARILISDPITAAGIELFKEAGFEVEVKTDHTKEELIAKIKDYDALIVRSQTKVTADVIAAAEKLKVIGRAGVGVDNVDVEAATKKGIIVLNAPDGNTISTAELTVAMILALARNIPQAHGSLKGGAWDRKSFTGVEVNGKTLGIVGMGRIGTEVAKRMQVMGMNINAYDPFLTQEKAESLGINLVDIDKIITDSDFITVHTPLTAETKGLFGAKEFARMKKGVRVVNCARGGIYDEAALAEAIKSGQVAGAAFDVYPVEPPTDRTLIDLPQVVVTPHLGASTIEAQENVAIDVAVEVIKVLKGESFKNAVNLPPLRPEVKAAIEPYTNLVETLGKFIAQLVSGRINKLEVSYLGEISKYDTSFLSLLFLKGVLQASLGDEVNQVNAMMIAKERGLKVTENKTQEADGYSSLIKVTVATEQGTYSVAGTVINKNNTRIIDIFDYHFDLEPTTNMLVIEHVDQPGIIGSVGTILGEAGINIASMTVGRKQQGGKAVMVISVDSEVSADTLIKLESLKMVSKAYAINL